MKFFYFLLLSLIFISFKNYSSNYQVECFSINSDGSLILKLSNPKEYYKYKIEDARKDAIDAVLFSGVSETNGCQSQPPLLNNAEERNRFNKIKNKFFSRRGEWLRFVNNGDSDSNIYLNKEKQRKTYMISVLKNELRKYLIEQKIIKPLDYGF